MELKNTASRLEKENEFLNSALQVDRDQYQEVTDAPASLVDLLVPAGNSWSRQAVIQELQGAAKELLTYVRDTTSTYVAHVLSSVKALKQDQDMARFAQGRVGELADMEYAALEEQVEPITQAIMERLEF